MTGRDFPIQSTRNNYERLQEKLIRAAGRAGTPPDEVTLVAVTKGVPLARIQEALALGIRHVGENRVQEALSKREAFPTAPSLGQQPVWHLIGHLQTNKAKKAIEIFDKVQSLDSLRLAEVLDREVTKMGRRLPCLVEVKVSPEPAKQGVLPEALDEFLDHARAFPGLRIEGLMTIAPYGESPEAARPYFRRARELFERHRGRFEGRPVLSMGMSGDFETAVEEGSTMIRIGTALFGSRPVPA